MPRDPRTRYGSGARFGGGARYGGAAPAKHKVFVTSYTGPINGQTRVARIGARAVTAFTGHVVGSASRVGGSLRVVSAYIKPILGSTARLSIRATAGFITSVRGSTVRVALRATTSWISPLDGSSSGRLTGIRAAVSEVGHIVGSVYRGGTRIQILTAFVQPIRSSVIRGAVVRVLAWVKKIGGLLVIPSRVVVPEVHILEFRVETDILDGVRVGEDILSESRLSTYLDERDPRAE